MSDSSAPPTYLHGTSAEEQSRLALMNSLLNERCLAEIAPRPGERVLEMGAGTGIFAAELARAVGASGQVVAIERDESQLAQASERGRRAGFEVRAGDAYAPPLTADEWSGFDLVHARFLLEHLARPLDAVKELVRAARPGGRVALVDDDHSLMRFWPDPGGMVELWDAFATQFTRIGCDPLIGRKLPALLTAAGARPVHSSLIYYGGSSGEPTFPGVIDNLARVVGTAREPILASTDWTAERFDETLAHFRQWSERPDATVWYAIPLVIGNTVPHHFYR